ncbi:hypothetical protein D3C71_1088140 [compost metagenome]
MANSAPDSDWVVALTYSGVWPKSAMPASKWFTATPARSPLPCSSKPGPMKAMSASTLPIAGQSCWKRIVPLLICPVASKRPLLRSNGQSSRSPLTSPTPPRTWPATSAASSQSVAPLLIFEWIQKRLAAVIGTSSMRVANWSQGRLPSPWNQTLPRTSAA